MTQMISDVWRCFHCGDVFCDAEKAREHFGSSEFDKPVCTVDAAYVRSLEEELARYRNEDTDLHKAICALQADLAESKRKWEQIGYDRGLQDGLELNGQKS